MTGVELARAAWQADRNTSRANLKTTRSPVFFCLLELNACFCKASIELLPLRKNIFQPPGVSLRVGIGIGVKVGRGVGVAVGVGETYQRDVGVGEWVGG